MGRMAAPLESLMMRRWRKCSLMLAGLALGALSFTSLIQLSSDPDLNGSLSRERRERLRSTERRIRLGWTAWADAELVSVMAEVLIERHFDVPVEPVMADIGIQFESVARGDLDLMLMAWLPVTHRAFWEQVRGRVEDLGTIYTGRLGLVVPEFVPIEQVRSIADLADPAIAKRFEFRIQGIDPGSALNDGARAALKAYNITTMQLVAGNLAVMAASLGQAIAQQRWIVVTSLIPHWMFATERLRFLEDPLGVFGGTERIHAIGHRGFSERFPQIAAFLQRFEIPDAEFSQLMLNARQSSTAAAVEQYLAQHPERVQYWISGDIGQCSDGACPAPQPPALNSTALATQ